jgi:hypothetical protein
LSVRAKVRHQVSVEREGQKGGAIVRPTCRRPFHGEALLETPTVIHVPFHDSASPVLDAIAFDT